MEICQLHPQDPWGRHTFAHAVTSKEIRWNNPGEICDTCHLPMHRRRLGPLSISWQPGCDVVGDLARLNRDGYVVTERVKKAFDRAGLTGYTAWPVNIKEPMRRARLRQPIVPSPYPGPPLWDIYIDTTEIVHVILQRSNVEFDKVCPDCGAEMYDVTGDAREQYFVVDRASWHGQDFMLPAEVNGVFVTERVVDVIRQNNFTNFDIIHGGHIGG